MTAPRSFWRGRASEGGQAIVLVAATMLGMIVSVGLAIDAGQLFVARRTAQEAADAGAYAGAVVIYEGGTAAQAASAAVDDIARNGSVGGGLTSVTVNAPPQNGPHALDVRYVEVRISTQVRTSLVPQQAGLTTVKVRAVAGAEPLNNAYALMALDRGATANALWVQANGHVDISGAGILVNSTSPTAANDQGTVAITPSPPYGTDVAGGIAGTWPAPHSGAPPRPDPFAGFAKPSVAGMPVYTSLPGGNPMVLSPGVYTVPVSAAGGTQIQMNSGVYVLKAGINGTGNADIVSGVGGVFLFNTTADYPTSSTGACGTINLNGNAASSLTPLLTGPYRGLLVYQDPACTATFTIAGNGSLSASGTIYLPNAPFVLNGNNATLTGSQLIAKTINAQNGSISISFSAASTAQPVLPRLSE